MASNASSLEEENLKLHEENIMLKKLLDLSEKNLLQIAYMASGSSSAMKSEEKSVKKTRSTEYSRCIKNDLFLRGLREKEFKTDPFTTNLEAITFVGTEVVSETPVAKLGQIQTRSSRKRPYS